MLHFYPENKLKSTGEQYICDEYVCEWHGSPPDTDESIWDIIARGPESGVIFLWLCITNWNSTSPPAWLWSWSNSEYLQYLMHHCWNIIHTSCMLYLVCQPWNALIEERHFLTLSLQSKQGCFFTVCNLKVFCFINGKNSELSSILIQIDSCLYSTVISWAMV